jgi:hypothetical protein
MHHEGKILYAGKSFGVQVKSFSQRNHITYGGFTNGKPSRGNNTKLIG